MDTIVKALFDKRDEKYAAFQSNLSPTVDGSTIIGVRTPELRKLAKEINDSDIRDDFLSELPHKYFEENQLHGFIISLNKDFDKCMKELETFLPFIDNWATCDQTSPKVLGKHIPELKSYISKWLDSEHTYTRRFGIDMLMRWCLDNEFDAELNDRVLKIVSDEYYINMAVAWYGATALAKNWDLSVCYLEKHLMNTWTHNKMIQKAVESYRIKDEQKMYLKTLKIYK